MRKADKGGTKHRTCHTVASGSPRIMKKDSVKGIAHSRIRGLTALPTSSWRLTRAPAAPKATEKVA